MGRPFKTGDRAKIIKCKWPDMVGEVTQVLCNGFTDSTGDLAHIIDEEPRVAGKKVVSIAAARLRHHYDGDEPGSWDELRDIFMPGEQQRDLGPVGRLLILRETGEQL